MKNFRLRKFTTRVKPITQKQIERLRATKLKKAKSYQEQKFFASKGFEKQIRANIKKNRATANDKMLNKVVNQIGGSTDERKVVRKLFQEKTRVNRTTGKKYTVNKFTTYTQYKRLQKAVKATKNKNSKQFKRYVQRTKDYKEIKQYLPDNPTTEDIVYAMLRGEFYIQNKKLIIQHNKNVREVGYQEAQYLEAGQKLADIKNAELTEEEKEFLDYYDKKVNKKR